MIIMVAMLLCHYVGHISYTLHIFMFCKHMQVLLKGYGLFLCLLNPIWQSRLAEGRNNLGTADDSALCPFLLGNPRFVAICVGQGSAGLKR